MDQAAWLAYFEAQQRAAIDAEHARIAAKLNAEHVYRPLPGFFGRVAKVLDDAPTKPACVVLSPGVVVTWRDDDIPGTARRLAGSAEGAGWQVRCVRSAAVDPRRGVVEVVTVRFARHDERGFAAWHSGRFDCAWCWSSTAQLERLGWRTTAKVRSVLDAVEGARRPLDMSLGS